MLNRCTFCRFAIFYFLLKCSHCQSSKNLLHLPCAVLSSSLHRHKISLPSSALECQSYECTQSRQRNFCFCSAAGFLLILAITHRLPIEVHQLQTNCHGLPVRPTCAWFLRGSSICPRPRWILLATQRACCRLQSSNNSNRQCPM